MEAILTFDIGTTACKTIFFDPEGRILAQSEQEYPMLRPEPMWAEQDPEDWWNAVVTTTRDCLKSIENAGVKLKVMGIGLSSQRETIVPVDSERHALRTAITWQDRRTNPQARKIAERFGKERVHSVSGMLPEATFSATKIMWLRENQPDVIDKAASLLQPKDYILMKLTGAFATDYSLASRTMMLDIAKGKWWDEMVDFVGVSPTKLPPIYHSDEVVALTTAESGAALGLPAGIPVVSGGGDRPCEALGAGIFGLRAMDSTGTASNISCSSESVPEPLDIRVLCAFHVLRGHYLIEQGMPTTGSVLKWFRDNFCGDDIKVAEARGVGVYDILNEAAASVSPESSKLLLLPFFMGSRSTRWNPDARGVVFGLTLNHSRGDVARAIMEGVSYECRACYDVLTAMNIVPEEVVVMGGGSKGAVWNQIKADITGKAVNVPRVTEAASLGAMILGASGAGLFTDPKEASRRINSVVSQYTPNQELTSFYSEGYDIYNELYDSMVPLFTRLEAWK